MLRDAVRRLLEDQSTTRGRVCDLVVQGTIVVWLVAYSIDTLPDLSVRTREVLRGIEVVVTLLFTAEYLLRLYSAERPLRFVLSFWGIVDVLSILPFYLSLTINLQSLRILRLLRLFRVLKLGRYSRALRRLQYAWRLAQDEFLMFFVTAMILLFLAAAGIHHFEHEAQPEKFSSIFTSLWWAVCTLTTVGYGDVYPVTPGGRVFTFVILMIGLGIVAVPAGLVTSGITRARELEEISPQEDADATERG
jgi:voltage-gated potassium channel